MQEGMTEAMVEALRNVEEAAEFTARERAALRFAEYMAMRHRDIDAAFFQALREVFSGAEIIELGMLIGIFIGYGRLLSAFDLEAPAQVL